ncbi:carboxylesterase family protein [Streptomyces sp. NPDC050617]|uniref:carboxylesterase/lipase family protein n=1 Tax=Streptomyces sp. NPDC050617 TaxID=3154628 RepID=UPI00344A091E
MNDRTTRTVTTAQGAVRGVLRDGFAVFHGIPYAASPSRAGRFAAPSPHEGWTGVRDATAPGPTAPQAERNLGAIDMSPYFGPGWIAGDSEADDYLTVDVWTPDDVRAPGDVRASDGIRAPGNVRASADVRAPGNVRASGGIRASGLRHGDHGEQPLPVMVFVHGGGFVAGSARAGLYDGAAFARSGAVLVTVQYRLGIAGFLDLPGAPRNRGLLDVFAALRWVRENIAAFGGDPERVTLFGQSAGATLTGAAIASPSADGLVRRAIVQSGSGLGAFTPEQAARVTEAAAAALGVAPDAEAFAAVTDADLVGAASGLGGVDLRTATAYDPLIGLSPFGLVLDEQPADAVAAGRGAAAGIDLLIGVNSEEGNLYLVPSGAHAASTAADVRTAAELSHPDPDRLLAAYRAERPGAAYGRLRSAVMGDALFGAGSWALAGAHAERSAGATYGYLFDWRSPALGGRLGAAHTVELPFVFGLDPAPLRGERALLGPADPPAGLAARMHAAWVRFARTGNPGWDAYDTGRRATMVIGGEWEVREDPRGAVRRAWQR